MRRIVYGSGVVLTTDDVADALLRLHVAVADLSRTDRITIPIVTDNPAGATVDLVIGPGIPLMSEPAPWHGAEPDFSTSATLLRMHQHYPHPPSASQVAPSARFDVDDWDPDLDGY